MISKNIILQLTSSSTINYNNNMNELDQKYFGINENEITLYSDVTYNIYLEPVNNEIYYFVLTQKHKLEEKIITNESISYTYLYDINECVFETNTLKFKKRIKTDEKEKKYSWYIFKLSKSSDTNYNVNTYINSGTIIIENPLIYISLNYANNILSVLNNEEDHIEIINKYNELHSIILYKDTNYLFKLNNNYKLHIYNDSYEEYDKRSIYYANTVESSFLSVKEIGEYKFNIDNINKRGNVYIYNLIDNHNTEIKEDATFRNISVNKLYYDSFIYNEYINIIKLNNIENNILLNESNKLFIIDKLNIKKIQIVLPSSNIEIGASYRFFLLKDLISLNIKCEDNNQELDVYDSFTGLVNIINKNKKSYKSIIQDYNQVNGNKNIDINNNIILKNSGLSKYGYIELYCINKINNKYVWFIYSNLLNNNDNNINNIFI